MIWYICENCQEGFKTLDIKYGTLTCPFCGVKIDTSSSKKENKEVNK